MKVIKKRRVIMESIEELRRKILENSPSSRTVYLLLKDMKNKEEPGIIIKECQKWLKQYPDDIHLRWLLVEAYLDKGIISLADSEVESLINSINEFNRAYRLQAEVLLKQDRIEEAIQSLNLYIAHFPEDEETRAKLQELEAKIKEEVEPVGEELVTEEAKEAEIVEVVTPRIAEVYFEQGLIEDAIETYKKVIEKNPDDEKSKARLEELKEILEKRTLVQEREKKKEKTEKTIAILEAWLDKIRKTMSQDRTSEVW